MSMVPTYVQGSDTFYYKNPVIGVAGNWLICWDDSEPVEILVTEEVVNTLKKLRDEHGFHLRAISKGRKSFRSLGSSYGMVEVKAYFCELISGAFPVSLLLRPALKVRCVDGAPFNVHQCTFEPAKPSKDTPKHMEPPFAVVAFENGDWLVRSNRKNWFYKYRYERIVDAERVAIILESTTEVGVDYVISPLNTVAVAWNTEALAFVPGMTRDAAGQQLPSPTGDTLHAVLCELLP